MNYREYELVGGPMDGAKVKMGGSNQPITIYMQWEPNEDGFQPWATEYCIRFPICYHLMDGRYKYSRRFVK